MWRLFFCCALLCACATPPITVKESPAFPLSSFNAELANLPEGAVRDFAQSPLGAVSVRAGEFYFSGLGHRCRFVLLTQGNQNYKRALCEEKTGGWYLVPAVFESLPQ